MMNHRACSPVAAEVAVPMMSEPSTQTDLLTGKVALQASGCSKCLVLVHEDGAESHLLQEVCPCREAFHQVKELHEEGDPDKLENCAHMKLMKLNKAKYKVLHLGWGNPRYQYRLGDEEIESSFAKKNLGALVDDRLDVTWQCELLAQKAKPNLGNIKSGVASRSRELILPLVRPHVECCIQLWGPQNRKDIGMFE
ncbi:hypothetical protein BTVI_63571 [Pitangus sulphuratus]|nr:hypothetical protein BTVI_63571 [Pitangus sulphuratus]